MAVKTKKLHKCCKCDKGFRDFNKLRTHMSKAHPKMHNCSMCGSNFKRKADLDRHILQMHGPNSIPCSIPGCNMRVAYNRLKRHIKEHHAEDRSDIIHPRRMAYEPDFKCPFCSKIYQNRVSLRKHISGTHNKPYTRSKTYPCTFEGCDKSFKAPCLLEDHINMHNDDYKYECGHCQKKFFSRAQFGVHLSKYHMITLKDTRKLVEDICDS